MDLAPSIELLTADVGNTSLRIALWSAERILSVVRLERPDAIDVLSTVLAAQDPRPDAERTLVLATVAPGRAETFLRRLERSEITGRWNVVRAFGPDCALDLENRTRHPEKVGVDRLLAASEARHRHGDAVVVDNGTALTVDAVTRAGVFLGGAIAPGMALMARALHEGTEGLPLVPLDTVVPRGPGRFTEEAIAVGIHHGFSGMIQRLVRVVGGSLDRPTLVATGGGADVVRTATAGRVVVVPHLVHHALRRLHGSAS